MYGILICDDERDIRGALRIYLTNEGYGVFEAATGLQALEILQANPDAIHLVLMDVMMPGMDGVTATTRIRESSNIPVILLTAKSEDTDKLTGLACGADDYVTKPFQPLEVLARVRAQLRRFTVLGGMENPASCLTVGDISLDDEAKTVTLSGEPVNLTPTEYDILRLLIRSPGKVFSSREIYAAVSGDTYGAEGSVPVHIRHLREKLEIDPANPRYLKVVWGKGYKLEGKANG